MAAPTTTIDCEFCGRPGTPTRGQNGAPLPVIHTEGGSARSCQLPPVIVKAATPTGPRRDRT